MVDRKLRADSGGMDEAQLALVGMLARKGYAPGLAVRSFATPFEDHAAAREGRQAI